MNYARLYIPEMYLTICNLIHLFKRCKLCTVNGWHEKQKIFCGDSGTPLDFTTLRTTFADQDMPKYAKICQHMPTYISFTSAMQQTNILKSGGFTGCCRDMPRYAKICQETKGKN
jgi:hypothetical protein